MALDDLDLEFEDEEEMKKKKNDAVHQDVDLEFQMQDGGVKARPSRPGAPTPPAGVRPQQPMAQVQKLDDARAAQQLKRPIAPGTPAPRSPGEATSPRSVGATALKTQTQPVAEGHYDLESEEIVQLRERARKAEFDADVRVQVADNKIADTESDKSPNEEGGDQSEGDGVVLAVWACEDSGFAHDGLGGVGSVGGFRLLGEEGAGAAAACLGLFKNRHVGLKSTSRVIVRNGFPNRVLRRTVECQVGRGLSNQDAKSGSGSVAGYTQVHAFFASG